MTQNQTDENVIQERALETLVKELEHVLPRLMNNLRKQAAEKATASIVAISRMPREQFGTFAEDCMAQERDAESKRIDALTLQGRIEGIRRIRDGMFGAMGVKSDNATVAGYIRNLDRHIIQKLQNAVIEIEAAALDALQYSPSHPQYGVARANAIKLDALSTGMRDVLDTAVQLGQSILPSIRAEAALG